MERRERIQEKLKTIKKSFKGDIFTDDSTCLMYATDASAYREVPIAVARPKDKKDIIRLLDFARQEKTSLIPRTAGTSLAGQVVGNGIIVDVSKYLTKILEINEKENWVRVEPGVVLDELNMHLEQFDLFFAPETSTSNRCMIGGMVGNNSCGAHSLIYGSTREHVLSLDVILSDGSEALFGPLTKNEFDNKCQLDNLEGKVYRNIRDTLSNPENVIEIEKQFPDKSIKRRNTGYAIDLLVENQVFSDSDKFFNFSKLLTGSEGTLSFLTEIKLNLIPLPPRTKGLLCVHFEKLEDALQANLIVLKHNPGAIELMDHFILEQTKNNIEQRKNRFFVKGDPGAILIIEFARDSRAEIKKIAGEVETHLRDLDLGYHFPLILGEDIVKVWSLRKAGLGVLSNVPGDSKPVAVIEDTAVKPEDLPSYISEFQQILDKHGLSCVYHAHIATGELHMRPVLNLKKKEHVELFHSIAFETAKLVKKYNGSLSGEHGDGRLRGEFIPLMIGEKNYRLLRNIKATWDPANIFNPGKIVGTPPMNTSLRYTPGQVTKKIDTLFDFSSSEGFLHTIEQCNGSGDCRKSATIGGVMCPSYMASHEESNSTRARANILREFLTHSKKANPFDHQEIYDIMDLCLSCKGCKSECPSNVDITKYKAEFLQHFYDANGVPFRTRMITNIDRLNRFFHHFPLLYNFFIRNRFFATFIKKFVGFARERSLPLLNKQTLKNWYSKHKEIAQSTNNRSGDVYLFVDEFTDYHDSEIGIKAIKLLIRLGYRIMIPNHEISGRTYLSKGLVRKAKMIAEKNVDLLKGIINEKTPLIGIEPSTILTFKDEYPELVRPDHKVAANKLANSVYMFEDFFVREAEKGFITKDLFTQTTRRIKLHGHCYQKALKNTESTKFMLSFPDNYSIEEIKSGCCGMAGSFGYEKEHYDLSMKIGELILFPEIRNSDENTLIAAPGTSCRHQINDGTGRKALHPVEILYDALIQT